MIPKVAAPTIHDLANTAQTPRRTRRSSFSVPARLQGGDDAQDDAAAPRSGRGQYMNQSFISLIANVGSNANSHPRFDSIPRPSSVDMGAEQTSNIPHVTKPSDDRDNGSPGRSPDMAKKKPSERNMLQSLPGFGKKPIRKVQLKYLSEDVLQSHEAPANDATQSSTMSSSDSREPFTGNKPESSNNRVQNDQPKEELLMQEEVMSASEVQPQTSLAERLKHIFGFENEEAVISEYPCWLLQSVLLQGYMYVTQRHICFYSYLPKKSGVIIKSGFLSKRGRQNPKFYRYWFVLKGDVLSYYSNINDLYFPSGNIDLKSGIFAEVLCTTQATKESVSFSIQTHHRTYQFKADSASSAKEWVKNLQKVIFRLHNDGDSVKISIPIDNIVDIEDNPVVDFAETFKIRVIDNEETFAVDEYFFSFFGCGKDALHLLRTMIEENGAVQDAMKSADKIISTTEQGIPPQSHGKLDVTKGKSIAHVEVDFPPPEVSPDLQPVQSSSTEPSEKPSVIYKDDSYDVSGNGPGALNSEIAPFQSQRAPDNVEQEPSAPTRVEPSPNLSAQSSGEESDSNQERQSFDTSSMTVSQILQRDDVFQNPTVRHARGKASQATGTVRVLAPYSGQSSKTPAIMEPEILPISTTSRSQASNQASTSTTPPETRGIKTTNDSGITHRAHTIRPSSSTSTLQDFIRAGSSPLQKASNIAELLRTHSKRMKSLLSTESKGYYEKVSSMWAGKKTHYDDAEGLAADDQINDPDDEDHSVNHGDRFRAHFALPNTEKLHAAYFAYLHRVIPVYGKLYIGSRKLCFRSLLPGSRTKMILPLIDIENVEKENGFRFGYAGLVLVIRGHEEVFFEFRQADGRDDCAVTLHQSLESVRHLGESRILSPEERLDMEAAKIENETLLGVRKGLKEIAGIRSLSETAEMDVENPQIMFDDPLASVVAFKPAIPMRVTCLTIGSRGDVQPYIALCKGLLAEGHKPTIATHAEFESWIRQHGIGFVPVAGDPAEIMRLCVEHDMFTFSFLREAASKFRHWIDELLVSSWEACQDAEILIESPSAMGGIHIAEALSIPYFRAFTMPWTTTRAYPHAFTVPNQRRGGYYNTCTYVMFDHIFWQAVAGQINHWRLKTLGLPPTTHSKLETNKVPFLYNFSPSVVVPPLDFNHWIHVTGYWFLDEGRDYQPPEELEAFISKARQDGKKIVYVGFGSIIVEDPRKLTKTVVESVLKADVRCILSKGWSERLGKHDTSQAELPLPDEVHQIKSVPHDWLFSRIDAAAHHGGAGTTGASLRAGIPTIVKPFFGDQFFFGSRVEDLGVGRCLKVLNTSVFARALWEATNSERMIIRARLLGEQIQKESGVDTAIQAIYRDLEYAKSLIKRKSQASASSGQAVEDDWTLVGAEDD